MGTGLRGRGPEVAPHYTAIVTFLIIGAGYTGSRVAQRLRDDGHLVVALHRSDADFTLPDATARLRELAPADCVALHSVPSLPGGAGAALLAALAGRARRVVYISTTGVYGAAQEVDERTPAAPRNEREQARVDTENAVGGGDWSSLILRPAAIYGPGRGAHVALAEGRYALPGDGANFISRIHVDDLAALAVAGLLGEVVGAYPVADEHPCSSREIADFCVAQYGLPAPVSAPMEEVPVSRRGNRRVDGRAVCRLLGVALSYPSYREGIPAAMRAMEGGAFRR